MIRDGIQPNDLWRSFTALPAWIQHPRVERGADYRAALHQPLDLLIGELTITGDQRAAIVMTAEPATAEKVQRLCHALVAQMRDIQDHAEAFKFTKQLDPHLT